MLKTFTFFRLKSNKRAPSPNQLIHELKRDSKMA